MRDGDPTVVGTTEYDDRDEVLVPLTAEDAIVDEGLDKLEAALSA